MTKSRSDPKTARVVRVHVTPIIGGVHFTVNGRSIDQEMSAEQLISTASAFLQAGIETMRREAKPMTASEVKRRNADALRRMPQRGRLSGGC